MPDGSVLTTIASLYAIYLLAAMSPGPNLLVISATALGSSRTHALATALGVSTGTFIYTAATFAGVAALVAEMSQLTQAVRVLGASYLVYLGVRHFALALRGATLPGGEVRVMGSWRQAYLTGLLTNLSNPKAILFYVGLLSLLIAPDTPNVVRLIGGAGIVALSIAWHASVAVATSQPRVRGAYTRARRWVEGLIGIGLLGAGLRIAFATRR